MEGRRQITDWFDVKDIKHLKAFDYLQRIGMWPEGFMPDDIEFGPQWESRIRSRMADAYVQVMLGNCPHCGKIVGSETVKAKRRII